VGVRLWAQAVEVADSDDPQVIRQALRGQCYRGPGGVVRIDPENQHTWKGVFAWARSSRTASSR